MPFFFMHFVAFNHYQYLLYIILLLTVHVYVGLLFMLLIFNKRVTVI